MTSDRTYRKALSKEDAFKEIRENAGIQFDPNIAKIFVQFGPFALYHQPKRAQDAAKEEKDMLDQSSGNKNEGG